MTVRQSDRRRNDHVRAAESRGGAEAIVLANERSEDPSEARRRIAVLVDGDNAQPLMLDRIMKEVARHGAPVIRRIYGDWASGRLAKWTPGLHEFAFQAVQQHVFVAGKNATDSRLIIDAMDVLHTSPWVEGFCIVSSDSDYTALAKRLREGGRWVLGIGEKKTPASFVQACERFIHTELLEGGSTKEDAAPKRTTKAGPDDKENLRRLLVEAIEAMQQEDGFADLGRVGQWLLERRPDFDSRAYRRKQLSGLFRLFPDDFQFRTVNGHEDFKWVRLAPGHDRD